MCNLTMHINVHYCRLACIKLTDWSVWKFPAFAALSGPLGVQRQERCECLCAPGKTERRFWTEFGQENSSMVPHPPLFQLFTDSPFIFRSFCAGPVLQGRCVSACLDGVHFFKRALSQWKGPWEHGHSFSTFLGTASNGCTATYRPFVGLHNGVLGFDCIIPLGRWVIKQTSQTKSSFFPHHKRQCVRCTIIAGLILMLHSGPVISLWPPKWLPIWYGIVWKKFIQDKKKWFYIANKIKIPLRDARIQYL